ncbi:hypothetical protein PSP6_150008 [Paraburkholderia tropica]|nr:hypothetical protein PSP6_150008 [Paraburkholderia tropica]
MTRNRDVHGHSPLFHRDGTYSFIRARGLLNRRATRVTLCNASLQRVFPAVTTLSD